MNLSVYKIVILIKLKHIVNKIWIIIKTEKNYPNNYQHFIITLLNLKKKIFHNLKFFIHFFDLKKSVLFEKKLKKLCLIIIEINFFSNLIFI